MNYFLKSPALLLSFLIIIFAKTQPYTDEVNRADSCSVSLASPDYTFGIQFRALFVQPSASNLSYAAKAIPLPLPSPNWNIFELHPRYRFGFDIGLNGIFHCANTNLRLNWERFRSTTCARVNAGTNNMIGPFFEIGPDATPYQLAQGTVVFHFEAIHLNYGQFVNFGDRLETNIFAGVGFARIKQNLCSNFSNPDGTIVRTITVPSQFIGAGPEFGLDFVYCIGNRFQFAGKAYGSLLVGTQKNHTLFQALSPALANLNITPPNRQFTCTQNKIQIVPGLYARLGFNYCFTFCEHYEIDFEAGYEARIYISPIQSIDMGSEVNTPPVLPDTIGVFARTFRPSISNFGLAGPYLSFNVGF